jgi:phage shock protein PspC (stress-responsive transcriptional regulator)
MKEKRLFMFGVAQVQLREKVQLLSDYGAKEENSEAPLRSDQRNMVRWTFLGVCAGITQYFIRGHTPLALLTIIISLSYPICLALGLVK